MTNSSSPTDLGSEKPIKDPDELAADHSPSEQKPIAHNAVRLMLPDSSNGLSENWQDSGRIVTFLERVFEADELDRLEILMMPGYDTQYEHYFVPRSTSKLSSDSSKQTTSQSQTLDAYTSASATSLDDPITTAIDETFDSCNWQTGYVDLSTLVEYSGLANRLLASHGATIRDHARSRGTGIDALLGRLIDNDLPHVYQVIIEPAGSGSHDYIVVVRLAVFDPEYGVVTDEDFERHLESTYQYEIADAFFSQSITSSFELPINSQLEESLSNNHIHLNEPFHLRVLATHAEYDQLIDGTAESDYRYEELFNNFGRIPVNKAAIPKVIPVIDTSVERSSWGRLASVNKPPFVQTEMSIDPEVQQRSRSVVKPEVEKDRDQSTSSQHYTMLNDVVKELDQGGWTVLCVDQTSLSVDLQPDPTETKIFPGKSRPDIVALKNERLLVVEIETNDSNPAAFLKNLQRAYHYGYNVAVVAESNDLLEKKFRQAECPCNRDDTTRYGVRLYNLSDEGAVSDETTIYLLPLGATEARWYLDTDATLTLVADGRVIAQGDADTPLSDFRYSCPKCVKEDGRYVVYAQDGEQLAAADTKQEALSSFTGIKYPFVPQRLMYLNRVNFYSYSQRRGLSSWLRNPNWASATKAAIRHQKSSTEFIELVTTQCEGIHLEIPDVRSLQRQSDWFSHQTDHDPPTESWFSRNLDFDMDPSTRKPRRLLNRTWQFPRGLDPVVPDFPEVTADLIPDTPLEHVDVDLLNLIDAEPAGPQIVNDLIDDEPASDTSATTGDKDSQSTDDSADGDSHSEDADADAEDSAAVDAGSDTDT